MYYAAANSYATQTSIGFSNTWHAIGFATRQMRDAYVQQAKDLATKAIKADEIAIYNGKRGQVDFYDADGNYHMHMQAGEFASTLRQIDPLTAAMITDDCGREVKAA